MYLKKKRLVKLILHVSLIIVNNFEDANIHYEFHYYIIFAQSVTQQKINLHQ
jgi:hypothetical protein